MLGFAIASAAGLLIFGLGWSLAKAEKDKGWLAVGGAIAFCIVVLMAISYFGLGE